MYSLLLTFCVLTSTPVSGVDTLQVSQPDPYSEPWRYTKFDRESGLAGIETVFEDRDGHMWFGTGYGVQRYDGYTWTTYTTADGLDHNAVSSILQDQDGSMWFGTGSGINRFDPKADEAERWTSYRSELDAIGLYGDFRALVQAKDGSIWAKALPSPETVPLSKGQLGRFDGTSWSLVPSPIGKARIWGKVLSASDGTIWFATGAPESNRLRTTMSGLEFGRGIFRFDPSPDPGQDAWTQYTVRDDLAGDNVFRLLEANDGSIWAACLQGGVSRFHASTKRGRRLPKQTASLPENTVDSGSSRTES